MLLSHPLGPRDHEEGNFGHRLGPFLWQQGMPSDNSFKWGIQLGEPTAQVKSPKRKAITNPRTHYSLIS